MAEVAVVIPAYNAAPFIAATLDGLRAQTFRGFTTVVVDDGSRDETARIVENYPEVRLISQKNGGVAAARNRGVRETRSDWIAFLDADDVWRADKLERQINVAQGSEAGAIFCDLEIIDREGSPVSQPAGPAIDLGMEALLLHQETIPQATSSTILVRRKVFDSIGGYDQNLATMADWDLLLRLRSVTTFAHLPLKLTQYRRYPGTMSRSVAMLQRESILILDKTFRDASLSDQWRRLETRSRAWNDLVLSGSHFEAGHWTDAIRFGLRALRRNPGLIGRFVGTPLRRARRGVSPAS